MTQTHPYLNRIAPEFIVPTLGGGRFALSDYRGHVVVINFWSAECAWSRRADVLLVYRMLTWEAKGVRVIGLAANVNEIESAIRHEVEARHVRYPVAFDYDHRVADLYRAATTPHFFVTDRQGIVRYIGALDDAGPEQREAKYFYLDRAVAALLANRPVNPAETPPFGCKLVRSLADVDITKPVTAH